MRNINKFKKFFAGGLASVLMAAVLAIPASAADSGSLSIPVSTVVRGDAGSTHVLAEKDVDTDLQGMVCDVMATGENQSSVHPGNDIVITSGSGQVTLEDVEREANVTTHADGQLTLGSEITATLVLGDDEVFSGGMDLEFSCEQPEPIEVCRDGKIVTINPEDRKETDTDAPCVLGEEDKPETLPNTGIGGVLGGMLGAGAIGASVKSWLESRSMLRSGVLGKDK